MNRIWALATNTFREAIRDKVLLSILVFGVLGVFVSLAFKELTIGDSNKVVRSLAQGGIDIFAQITAMFLGISLVWKELDKKTIYTVLSKPIPRWMFIVGKYLGLMMTLSLLIGATSVIYILLMSVVQSFPPPIFFASILLLVVEIALLTAWATLFSSYSAPTTAAALLLGVFVIGHLADDIWIFGNQSDNPAIKSMARALYWILPNFEALSIRSEAVHGVETPVARVWQGLVYGLSYTAAALSFAVVVFKRKDIK